MLMNETGNHGDRRQEHAWNVRDDDRPLAWFGADAIDSPKQAVNESRQRLPEYSWISRHVRSNLRNVGYVHDH